MTQEDKELLLKDLSARLPYKVMCQVSFDEEDIHIEPLESVRPFMSFNQITTSGSVVSIDCVKSYLRPLSSMTEEEEIYYNTIYTTLKFYKKEDWLNAHHFDYRGLIPMGLALEAPKDMYK